MPDQWSDKAEIDSRLGRPDTKWFEEAKFGLFIHWGLYSRLGNEWKGQRHFGSAEWLMNRAKIPAAEYAEIAREFNPTEFNAQEWARFAREAGMRYMVVTAKHHEGFAMFASKASPFNIVDASPYGKDPMKALAEACGREAIKFGFYYSQFLDWHEPNGGGNRWDFDESKKDVKRYYAEKSIPQIKELLSNYGPLGLVWFDMPGGLTREETVSFMMEVRKLQPSCLVSSRVGRGLGDFRDFGDSELPPGIIRGPWEALFTHNDSWGYAHADQNFKTPREILRLLAATAARGGNLLLNVGPDGQGRLPDKSVDYLRQVGTWLRQNGESIYGTTASPVPDQPWGHVTAKPGRLFLHVFEAPTDGKLQVPGVTAKVTSAGFLGESGRLAFRQEGEDLTIQLPAGLRVAAALVVEIRHEGSIAENWALPAMVSRQFRAFNLNAALARVSGGAKLTSQTSSQYFGNWKHDTCVTGWTGPDDKAVFSVRFVEPGDYRLVLEYACQPASKGQEGTVRLGRDALHFLTLPTGEYHRHQPIAFFRHPIGIVSVPAKGVQDVTVTPNRPCSELFWLRRLIVEPVE